MKGDIQSDHVSFFLMKQFGTFLISDKLLSKIKEDQKLLSEIKEDQNIWYPKYKSVRNFSRPIFLPKDFAGLIFSFMTVYTLISTLGCFNIVW